MNEMRDGESDALALPDTEQPVRTRCAGLEDNKRRAVWPRSPPSTVVPQEKGPSYFKQKLPPWGSPLGDKRRRLKQFYYRGPQSLKASNVSRSDAKSINGACSSVVSSQTNDITQPSAKRSYRSHDCGYREQTSVVNSTVGGNARPWYVPLSRLNAVMEQPPSPNTPGPNSGHSLGARPKSNPSRLPFSIVSAERQAKLVNLPAPQPVTRPRTALGARPVVNISPRDFSKIPVQSKENTLKKSFGQAVNGPRTAVQTSMPRYERKGVPAQHNSIVSQGKFKTPLTEQRARLLALRSKPSQKLAGRIPSSPISPLLCGRRNQPHSMDEKMGVHSKFKPWPSMSSGVRVATYEGLRNETGSEVKSLTSDTRTVKERSNMDSLDRPSEIKVDDLTKIPGELQSRVSSEKVLQELTINNLCSDGRSIEGSREATPKEAVKVEQHSKLDHHGKYNQTLLSAQVSPCSSGPSLEKQVSRTSIGKAETCLADQLRPKTTDACTSTDDLACFKKSLKDKCAKKGTKKAKSEEKQRKAESKRLKCEEKQRKAALSRRSKSDEKPLMAQCPKSEYDDETRENVKCKKAKSEEKRKQVPCKTARQAEQDKRILDEPKRVKSEKSCENLPVKHSKSPKEIPKQCKNQEPPACHEKNVNTPAHDLITSGHPPSAPPRSKQASSDLSTVECASDDQSSTETCKCFLCLLADRPGDKNYVLDLIKYVNRDPKPSLIQVGLKVLVLETVLDNYDSYRGGDWNLSPSRQRVLRQYLRTLRGSLSKRQTSGSLEQLSRSLCMVEKEVIQEGVPRFPSKNDAHVYHQSTTNSSFGSIYLLEYIKGRREEELGASEGPSHSAFVITRVGSRDAPTKVLCNEVVRKPLTFKPMRDMGPHNEFIKMLPLLENHGGSNHSALLSIPKHKTYRSNYFNG